MCGFLLISSINSHDSQHSQGRLNQGVCILNAVRLRCAPVLGRPVCRRDGEMTMFTARGFPLAHTSVRENFKPVFIRVFINLLFDASSFHPVLNLVLNRPSESPRCALCRDLVIVPQELRTTGPSIRCTSDRDTSDLSSRRLITRFILGKKMLLRAESTIICMNNTMTESRDTNVYLS